MSLKVALVDKTLQPVWIQGCVIEPGNDFVSVSMTAQPQRPMIVRPYFLSGLTHSGEK